MVVDFKSNTEDSLLELAGGIILMLMAVVWLVDLDFLAFARERLEVDTDEG